MSGAKRLRKDQIGATKMQPADPRAAAAAAAAAAGCAEASIRGGGHAAPGRPTSRGCTTAAPCTGHRSRRRAPQSPGHRARRLRTPCAAPGACAAERRPSMRVGFGASRCERGKHLGPRPSKGSFREANRKIEQTSRRRPRRLPRSCSPQNLRAAIHFPPVAGSQVKSLCKPCAKCVNFKTRPST